MSNILAKIRLPQALSSGEGVGDGRLLLARLYDAHWKGLCRYVLATFGAGPPDPEDVAHEAFVKFAALEDSSDIRNPKAYLYAAARNFVIDSKRRERRHVGYARELESAGDAQILSELSPERVSLDRERFSLFAAALENLPAQRRRIILLNRFEGLSCEEIGRRFGMSGPAVQKQIERALAECLRHMNRAAGGRRE